MSPDDFSEGVIGVVPGVTGKQFQIGIAHLHKDNVASGGIRQRISEFHAKRESVRVEASLTTAKVASETRARWNPFSRMEEMAGRCSAL